MNLKDERVWWKSRKLQWRVEAEARAGAVRAPERPAQDALVSRVRAHRRELRALRAGAR